MKKLILVNLGWLSLLLLVACAGPKHMTEGTKLIDHGQLPALVADYHTTTQGNHHPSKQLEKWRLIRNPSRIEVFDLDARVSDIWSITSNDLWFLERAFHDDKTLVLYSPGDLTSLGIQPNVTHVATLIGPEILNNLHSKPISRQHFGYAALKYSGKFQEQDYQLIWLHDAAIPMKLKKRTDTTTLETELKSLKALDIEATAFSDISQYRIIDYSDLGDMERDPFVQKIQAHLPGAHVHHHH